ncbi:MAG: cytochrome c oxidase assembly protein [Dehalococcoidia bacterium]|nr:cytochrome c oxidase assembly protein [Dehalococcoidia bacterium]
MTVNWWPVAAAGEWEWAPALHLGPLLIALAPLLVTWAVVRWRGAHLRARRRRLLLAGTALLVLTLNWPLGDIASVSLAGRTVQYLALTLAAAPLVLLGIPRWSASGRGVARRWVERALGSALAGAAMLGVVVWTTHAPAVVDGLEGTSGGATLVRTLWLVAAFWFWWPLVGPGPDRERLPYLAGLVYLILPFAFPKFPAAIWVFSREPVYEAFQAFRGPSHPFGWSPTADQGIAGFVLWLPGSVMVAVALYLLIRHWWQEDRRMGLRQRLGVPADPEAVAMLVGSPDTWAALEALVEMIDEAAPPRNGSDLGCEVEGGRVLLQLHFPGTEEEQADILARVDAHYRAYLRRFDTSRAAAIEARLGVEVLPYGSRVR